MLVKAKGSMFRNIIPDLREIVEEVKPNRLDLIDLRDILTHEFIHMKFYDILLDDFECALRVGLDEEYYWLASIRLSYGLKYSNFRYFFHFILVEFIQNYFDVLRHIFRFEFKSAFWNMRIFMRNILNVFVIHTKNK